MEPRGILAGTITAVAVDIQRSILCSVTISKTFHQAVQCRQKTYLCRDLQYLRVTVMNFRNITFNITIN